MSSKTSPVSESLSSSSPPIPPTTNRRRRRFCCYMHSERSETRGSETRRDSCLEPGEAGQDTDATTDVQASSRTSDVDEMSRPNHRTSSGGRKSSRVNERERARTNRNGSSWTSNPLAVLAKIASISTGLGQAASSGRSDISRDGVRESSAGRAYSGTTGSRTASVELGAGPDSTRRRTDADRQSSFLDAFEREKGQLTGIDNGDWNKSCSTRIPMTANSLARSPTVVVTRGLRSSRKASVDSTGSCSSTCHSDDDAADSNSDGEFEIDGRKSAEICSQAEKRLSRRRTKHASQAAILEKLSTVFRNFDTDQSYVRTIGLAPTNSTTVIMPRFASFCIRTLQTSAFD